MSDTYSHTNTVQGRREVMIIGLAVVFGQENWQTDESSGYRQAEARLCVCSQGSMQSPKEQVRETKIRSRG